LQLSRILQGEKSDVFGTKDVVSFEESDQTNHPANQRREPVDMYFSLLSLVLLQVVFPGTARPAYDNENSIFCCPSDLVRNLSGGEKLEKPTRKQWRERRGSNLAGRFCATAYFPGS
jgi:hypothetical protein